MNTAELTPQEIQRYSRHLLLPEVGRQGQQKLKSAAVLVVGAGGLGSPVILYLAAAGIGKIGVADFDRVEASNLQRQIIFVNEDIACAKAQRAALRAGSLNPEIAIESHELRLCADNACDLIQEYDIVVDGSDNFSTRYLVNDACVLLGKPNVYGSIYRFEGQASVFACPGGPCYRCLFPIPPPQDAVPNCAEGGVLGVIAGLIGCIQATEALKLILGIGSSLAGKLLLYDALAMTFDTLPIPRDPNCPICGTTPTITSLEDTSVSCTNLESDMSKGSISPVELNKELKDGNELTLLDVRTHQEVALCRLDNSIHIPLAELPSRINELNPDAEIVAYCKAGMRSLKAIEILGSNGFRKLRNLDGGIAAWAREVDQSLNVY